MAQDVTVDLGSFTISSHTDKGLCLTVSTAMSLSLPENLPSVPTAVELWDQVKAGLLWITRAGSCRFALSIYFEELADDLPHADLQDRGREMVMEAFQAFPAWAALGLELRHEVNLFQEEPDFHVPFVYSVQHNRQHSSLFTPEGVACGYLSAVSSSFRFSTRGTCTKRQPINNTRIIILKVPPHELQRVTGGLNQPSEFHKLPLDLQAERLKHLTHNALNLVVGLKKKPSGARLLEPSKSPALLHLAPAVWNSVSFQDVVARAQLVPSISSVLANLSSTQSPVLRQKVEDLVRRPNLDSPLEDASGELQRRLLVLLLRATHAQRTKLRGPGATRQPRIQVGELVQNDQIGELGGPQISQYAGSVYDTPLDHGIPPYAILDDAGEASASDLLGVHKPLNEEVFDGSKENLGRYEHIEENEFVPLESMSYYSDRIPREDTQAEFQRQNHFDPDDMDGDDTMEDTIVYTTRDCAPSCQQPLFSPDEMYQQTLSGDAQGHRRNSPHPDDMNDNEDFFEDGEYYLVDEEEHLQYRTTLGGTHSADLATSTPPYTARVCGGYDDEASCFEEGRETPRRIFEDNSDEYRDADEAFEYAILHYENAGDYPYELDVQDQYEVGFYEGPDEDFAYIPPRARTQDELHDQFMHSMSGVGIEIRDNPISESTEHTYDYRTGGVCTPEYTYQFEPADDIEAEATAIYARVERFSHGLNQVPRIYSYPRSAHWTESMGVDQDVVETQPSQRDA